MILRQCLRKCICAGTTFKQILWKRLWYVASNFVTCNLTQKIYVVARTVFGLYGFGTFFQEASRVDTLVFLDIVLADSFSLSNLAVLLGVFSLSCTRHISCVERTSKFEFSHCWFCQYSKCIFAELLLLLLWLKVHSLYWRHCWVYGLIQLQGVDGFFFRINVVFIGTANQKSIVLIVAYVNNFWSTHET